MMTLEEALLILCRVHTGDCEASGFRIEVGARSAFYNGVSYHEWIKAWAVVRKACRLRVTPEQYEGKDSDEHPVLPPP